MSQESMSDRVRNSRRNVVAGSVRTAVSLLASFVTRTVLIHTLGVEYVGLNGLFSSVLQVLNLAELGLGTAIIYALYQPVATGDDDVICAYLCFFRRAYRVIGLVVLACGVAAMPFLPALVEGGRLPDNLSMYACWLIILADTTIGYFAYGYLACIPTAHQRGDILSKVDVVVAFLRLVAQSAMLVAHAFYGFLLVLPVMTVVRNLVVARRVRQLYPRYVCRGALDNERRQDLRRNLHGLFVSRLFATLRNGIDTMCLSAFLGLAIAGIYNNYLVVLSGLISVTTMLLTAIIPGVGNSVAVESAEKNYRDLRRFDFIYSSAAGWVATCLLCMWQPFMRLWVGDALMLDWPEAYGLVLYYYILKSGDMWSVYGEALGLWWNMRHVSVAEAVANVVLNVTLSRWLGVRGVVLASLITLVALNFVPCPCILWRSYFKGHKVGEFFLAHGQWLLSTLPGAALCLLLCTSLSNDLLGLAMRGLVCMVGYPLVWWLVWHRTERFDDAVSWVRNSGLLSFR